MPGDVPQPASDGETVHTGRVQQEGPVKNVDELMDDIYRGPEKPKTSIRKVLLWVVAFLALTLLMAHRSHAQQRIRAMFCDTAAESKEVLLAPDANTAAALVNNRDGDNACGGLDVIADTIEDGEQVEKNGKTYAIAKVHIIGMVVPPGMVVPMDATQYASHSLPGQGT